MQHPDESTIHEWLDGELRPEQAAELEAHVAECAECKSKVAEARGLIAASTRILTALDHVPRGVIPAVPSRSRFNSPLLRVAALLCVVAGGAFIFRLRTADVVSLPTTVERVVVADTTSSALPAAPSAKIVAAVEAKVEQPARRRAPIEPIVAEPQAQALNSAPAPMVMAKTNAADSRDMSSLTAGGAASQPSAMVQGAVAFGRVAGGSAMMSDGPLKILSEERVALQQIRTRYEVSNRIAVLVERDTSTGPTMVASAVSRRARTAGAGFVAGTPPESASSTPMLQVPSVATIEWKDEATGRLFTLSGPFSFDELRNLKQRIIASRSDRSR